MNTIIITLALAIVVVNAIAMMKPKPQAIDHCLVLVTIGTKDELITQTKVLTMGAIIEFTPNIDSKILSVSVLPVPKEAKP